jgi:hypothetical protein
MERYRGEVEEARLDDMDLPLYQQSSPEPIQEAIRRGDPLTVLVTAGRRPRRTAPIFAVYDEQQWQVFMLAATRRDLTVQSWNVAAALRLDRPIPTLVGAGERLVEGEQSEIVVEALGRTRCVRVDGEAFCPQSPDAAWLWSFLLIDDSFPIGSGRLMAMMELLILGGLLALSIRGGRRALMGGVALSAVYVVVSSLPVLAGADPWAPVAILGGTLVGIPTANWLRIRLGGGGSVPEPPPPTAV